MRMINNADGDIVWVPDEVAPAAPVQPPAEYWSMQGRPSYDSVNVGSDNYVRFGDKYYKQGGPEYNSDGNLVSAMGAYDWANPLSYEQAMGLTMGEHGAIPMTISPEYNVDDGTMTGLLGAGLLFGGLGAFGGLLGGEAAAATGAGDLGYIDALGGMTDATGTALSGWGDLAATMPVTGSGAITELPSLEGLELGGEGVVQAASSAAESIPTYLDPNAPAYSGSSAWDFGPGNFQDGGWGYGPGNINDVGMDSVPLYLDPNAPAYSGGTSWLDTINRLLGQAGTSGVTSAARSGLSSLLGIPDNVAGGALGLLSWLAARDQRNNQASQNASNVAALRSPAFNAPLNPTAFAGPQMRNVMGATPSTPRQNVTPTWNQPIRRAEGGALSRMSNNTAGPSMSGYAAGGTKGQDDKIPALLSDGEYVLDADIVAALGDGNNAAGAAALDKMRENIRRHKRSAPANKIPPKAKSPEAYMKGAK